MPSPARKKIQPTTSVKEIEVELIGKNEPVFAVMIRRFRSNPSGNCQIASEEVAIRRSLLPNSRVERKTVKMPRSIDMALLRKDKIVGSQSSS